MKKNIKNGIKIINALLVIFIVGVLLFEVRLLTRAQGDGAAVASEVAQRDKSDQCLNHMQSYMAAKKVDFAAFMDENFRSDKPTSALVDSAIAKYRQYRKDINIEILTFTPEANKTMQVAISENPKCATSVTEDLELMRAMIRQHIMQNAYAKKSTRLIDKYKEINGKLEELNFTIAQMYGYFGALSQKLPCYTEECTSK